VTADGGSPSRLTNIPEGVGVPTVDPDSQSVTYSTGGRVWRIPIGGGTPGAITDIESNTGVVSPDGTRLACYVRTAPTAQGQLAFFPAAGGKPLRIVDLPRAAQFHDLVWSPDSRSIDMVVTTSDVANLWGIDRDTGALSQVTHFSSGEILHFAWSMDGKTLALSRANHSSDAVLVTDAR
jgi:Tol biopolymer transport system component